MSIRKNHNVLKFKFLQSLGMPPGARVLDMGCGFGGDFHKWINLRTNFIGADPSAESLEEARRRFPWASLIHGDISSVPKGLRFECICFNFSLQYCKPVLHETLDAAWNLLDKNGIVVGVVPDGNLITDSSEYCTRNPDGTLTMYIPGVPYYDKYGAVTEPILTRSDVESFSKFKMERWQSFYPGSIYSTFILRKCG
jgi:ubiquinone/menaquinone biosynthesis C-methylase UbiE